MSFFPDMGTDSMVTAGEHVRAVGWLHPDHEYTKGDVPVEFLLRLKTFIASSGASSEALYFGAFFGFHTCEFCDHVHGVSDFGVPNGVHGSRNFGVPDGDLLFVAPEMIGHYVEQHGYCPPPEFVAALMRSPLPESEEYRILTEPFWHLHRDRVHRMMRAAEPSSPPER
jgi:hypothetical protein